ncbi:unnamed protein product [Calicophoron daubneyi]|uniref:Kinesin motor domain-containing protein n=1 Tax=Calicophoron daubneyi TaxID=300641 RepID=A0AAV2TKJ4_CALDB
MSQQNQARQNIRVAVRCRPFNKTEKERGDICCVECSREKVTVKDRISNKVFTFDHVFGPFSKQADVYNEMVSPVVEEILMGYNCTIFAYGQTGSGKTFTMTGERSDKLRYAWETDPMVGIIPRALSHLFETLQQNGSDFSVRVSFLEVYNEELFDLLSAAESNRLTIYDDTNRKGSVIVKGLREVVVLDKENVHAVIERGLARRQTASTLLNAQSSRSHSIFTVTVHIREVSPSNGEELLRIGKLHLVDLAGSESVGRSGAVDKRAREAGSINQSLLTLGRVITALVEHAPHVPYRESKLTRLLQDSLGGKTKTSIIATINPNSASLEETLSTLDYAHRAKNIQNRPEVNARLNKVDLVRGYNEELERLRRDLEATRTQSGVYIDEENYRDMQLQISQQRQRICELEERREILEDDIQQTQELFTITQSELTETRERKELVENELMACQSNLDEMRERFLKMKARFEEEEHLRREHEKTEVVLHEQANSLLSTARSAVGDVQGLHAKVARLTELDRGNRDRLKALPESWATDQLASPSDQLTELAQKVDVFCQSVRNALSDIRVSERGAVALMIEEQESLKNELASCLATECIDAAERTDAFATNQADVAKSCRETTLMPRFDALTKQMSGVLGKLESFNNAVSSHYSSFCAFNDRISDVTKQLEQFAQGFTGFVDLQKDMFTKTQQLLADRHAQESVVCERLRSTLADLEHERTKTQEMLLNAITSNESHMNGFYETNLTNLTRAAETLTAEAKTAVTHEQAFQFTGKTNMDALLGELDQISSSHSTLHSELDRCLESMCQSAVSFSTVGLGADLRHRAELWKKPVVESDQSAKHAAVQLERLTKSSTQGIDNILDGTTSKALALENITGDTRFDVSTKFESVQSELKQFPEKLRVQLADEVKDYTPTGHTPQPHPFKYPTDLAQTASHKRLLRAFRIDRQLKGFEQIALTPLPDGDHSLDSSLSPANTSDSSHLRDDNEGEKENCISTSGLGSESTATGIMTEQNTPTVGRIITVQAASAVDNVGKTDQPCKLDLDSCPTSDPSTPVARPKRRNRHDRRKVWL